MKRLIGVLVILVVGMASAGQSEGAPPAKPKQKPQQNNQRPPAQQQRGAQAQRSAAPVASPQRAKTPAPAARKQAAPPARSQPPVARAKPAAPMQAAQKKLSPAGGPKSNPAPLARTNPASNKNPPIKPTPLASGKNQPGKLAPLARTNAASAKDQAATPRPSGAKVQPGTTGLLARSSATGKKPAPPATPVPSATPVARRPLTPAPAVNGQSLPATTSLAQAASPAPARIPSTGDPDIDFYLGMNQKMSPEDTQKHIDTFRGRGDGQAASPAAGSAPRQPAGGREQTAVLSGQRAIDVLVNSGLVERVRRPNGTWGYRPAATPRTQNTPRVVVSGNGFRQDQDGFLDPNIAIVVRRDPEPIVPAAAFERDPILPPTPAALNPGDQPISGGGYAGWAGRFAAGVAPLSAQVAPEFSGRKFGSGVVVLGSGLGLIQWGAGAVSVEAIKFAILAGGPPAWAAATGATLVVVGGGYAIKQLINAIPAGKQLIDSTAATSAQRQAKTDQIGTGATGNQAVQQNRGQLTSPSGANLPTSTLLQQNAQGHKDGVLDPNIKRSQSPKANDIQ